MTRTVFFVSDNTAITTETLGHSLLRQFPGLDFRHVRVPFTDTDKKCRAVVEKINTAARVDGAAPLVFNTIVDKNLCEIIQSSEGVILDLLASFIPAIETGLGVSHEPQVGQSHGISSLDHYEDRMDATNYALTHDDGMSLDFTHADLVLVGVSRCGKTPSCLYMALHFGIKAANYPLTPEDLDQMRMPSFLRRYKHKIVGLTIDPDRLSQIRETRKPGSRYASIRQCRQEVDAAASLMRMEGVTMFDMTHSSVEEISSRVLLQLGLQKEHF